MKKSPLCCGRPALLALLLAGAFLLACCGGDEAASEDEAADDRLQPRVSAEHPVTSPPALAAGVWERGEAADAAPGMAARETAGEDAEAPAPDPVVPLLPAADLEASRAFYAGLGFEVVASEPDEPPFRRLELARGSVRLALFAVAAPADPEAGEDEATEEGGTPPEEAAGAAAPRTVVRIPVADLTAAGERLEAAGMAVEERDGALGRGLAVRDPAGNPLLLVAASNSNM